MKTTMKAIVLTKNGSPDGLQLQEVEKPVPRDNEVLIRVYAATVITGDVILRRLHPLIYIVFRLFGIRRKRIPGHEFAGEIEAVGSRVTRFKKGDEVFGTTTGLSVGANAEYVCLPEAWGKGVLAEKPANMTYEEAAVVPVGGLEALHFMRKANIQRGEKVLIVGAGGSIGTMGIQLARYFGAEVTGVDSTGKLDMLRSIGADHVIDYTQEDFTRNGQTYDVIFDVMGKSSFSGSIHALKPNGRYLLGGNSGPSQMLRGRWVSMTGTKKVIIGAASQRIEDLVFLKELMRQGR